MSKQLNVLLSSLKMALATFCSRILGLVREQVLAFYFGASGITDAFLIAYRIPNMLRDLFAEGAFSAAFVPSFVEANLKNKENARELLWALFIVLLVITGTFTGLVWIFTEEIINLMAPTFHEDPDKFAVAVTLTQMMAPFLTFVSIAAIFMGALNSLKIFFIPSLAPAFFNVSMILSIVFLPSLFVGDYASKPWMALGIGVFLGGLLQALVQFPLIIKHGYGPKIPKEIFSKKVKDVLAKLGPGLVGFAATQLNLIVNTVLASMSAVGAVSWLSYAFRLFQLPVGILSVSIGNSNLVHFSDAWKRGEKEEAKEYLATSYFMSMFMVLPAMCALVFLSEEMINVIFERGKFTSFSTGQTAKALRWYALGLPFYSIYKIFVPSFYAIDRQKIPVICSMLSVGFNIIFCITLAPKYGFEVLALGTTLSIFLNSLMQALILKKDISLSWAVYLNKHIVKILICFAFSSFCIVWAKQFFDFMSYDFLKRCLILTLYLVIVASSYFGMAIVLGERALVKRFIRRIMRK